MFANVRQDLALPVPAGWTPPAAEEVFDPDEGAVAASWPPKERTRLVRGEEEDEGEIDERGVLVGHTAAVRVVAERTPEATTEEETSGPPSSFLAGLGEASSSADVSVVFVRFRLNIRELVATGALANYTADPRAPANAPSS